VVTGAGSNSEEDPQPFMQACAQMVPVLGEELTKHHEICSKISAGTFSADKVKSPHSDDPTAVQRLKSSQSQ